MYKIGIYLICCLIVSLPQTVFAVSTPVLSSPENGTTVSKSTLSWEPVDGSLQYKVYVDDEPTITSPYIKDYQTPRTSYSPQLTLGTYYWKVASQDPDKNGAFSEIRSFTLVEAPTETPTPTPEPTSTPEPPHTPTPTKTPTPIKTPTPTKINSPTVPVAKSLAPNTPSSGEEAQLPPSILGASSTPSGTPQPSPTPKQASIFSLQNLFFAAGGAILILFGIFILTFIAKDRFKRI